jgi:prepilin-type N-terminal cleavage/methylation domain-containing protein/prepilin-type processing-associated H-X9-DG protein
MRSQQLLKVQPQNRGFTIVELLVSLAIIALLMSMLMPAVQQGREAARKSQCQHNLRQLGLAMHHHASTFNRLPALGYMGVDSKGIVTPFFGWTVKILQQMEQDNLYRKWDFNQPLSDPANQAAAAYSVSLFRCPSDPTLLGNGDLSYVANGGYGWTVSLAGANDCAIGYPSLNPIDINGNGIRCPKVKTVDGNPSDSDLLIRTGMFFLESWQVPGVDRHHSLDTVLDGQTNTILLSENIRAGRDPLNPQASWATADPLRMGFFLPSDICNGGSCSDANMSQAVANSTNGINSGLGLAEGQAPWPSSLHASGVNVCMADGSIKFLSENISSIVYYALVTSQGSLFQGAKADASISGL